MLMGRERRFNRISLFFFFAVDSRWLFVQMYIIEYLLQLQIYTTDQLPNVTVHVSRAKTTLVGFVPESRIAI